MHPRPETLFAPASGHVATRQDHRALERWFPRSGVGPLSGVLIADLTRVLAGPYATMLMADLGATVIKVEAPAGDETRTWRPPTLGDESTYYLSVNRNKHSIALDLGDPDDARVARSLVARSDVLIENFKPRSLARFGLDHDTVSRLNPSIIYASITGFGSGEGAHLPGYDLLVQAMSGMMDLTGDPESSPYRSGVAVFDVITGLHAALGVLAALHHRTRTGEGQRLELNLMSSALSGLVNQTGAYVIAGDVPHRMGNAHPSIYPYEPFATASGQLVLAIGNDGQFTRLCAAIGLDEVATDPRFVDNHARNEHRDELRALLLAALARHTAEEWYEHLSVKGIPCAPILDVAGGIRMAERMNLDPVVCAGVPDGVDGIRHPIDFSRTPATYDHRPPRLDEAGAHVRAWLADAATDA